MDIYEQSEKIINQQDFVSFLNKLIMDFNQNKNQWENDDLLSFLKGLEGYASDKFHGEVSWKTFAEILLAARVYE
ncbi:MAG: hypothetical protein H6574_20695 [Lewinellaceae bacterium]|nr:hypothetical protein [Lewinellaceae bacterium]